MFTPPPTPENLQILRRSARGKGVGGNKAIRAGFVITLTLSLAFWGYKGHLIQMGKPSTKPLAPTTAAVAPSTPPILETYSSPAIDVSQSDVKRMMQFLDEQEELNAKRNFLTLQSRAPSKPQRDVDPTPTFSPPSPTPRADRSKLLMPSSGEWLGPATKMQSSGLSLINENRAVFIKNGAIADFKVGGVLPNGEVVSEIDPANLIIKTDRRIIQLIDDGT